MNSLGKHCLELIFYNLLESELNQKNLFLAKIHSHYGRQYGLWSFQTGGTKLDRFLPKNQHTQRKLLNFENWVDGEVSKIEHHF